jgi:transposase
MPALSDVLGTERGMADSAGHPTVEGLLALVDELRARLAAVEAENARLRAEVAALRGDDAPPGGIPAASGEPPVPSRKHAPPWVKANVIVMARHRPRRARAPVPGRRREVPDRIVVHAPTHCPACAAPLDRGRVVGRRQVLDLPPVRAEVVEHRVLERTCRQCGARCRGVMPDLGEQVGAQRRVAWPVAAWVATLRTKLRLPLAQLQWLLARGWGVRLSRGHLSALLAEAARVGRPAYEALLAEARASPVVHLDETGWREAGRTGWVWTLSTPTIRLFHFSRSRAGAVAAYLLGEEGVATVVSDFYGAYDRLERVQQRCWAHLLRDIHDLVAQHPDDQGVAGWAARVRAIYDRAVAWAAAATAADTRPILRERARDRFQAELVTLGRAQPAAAPSAVLCARIARYQTELFTFVADPAVPPTNNAAERALRPLVIARKISGGTRSDRGTTTRMVLQSLVATWDLRGLDPVAEFLALLRAPQPTQEIAPV